MAPRDQSILPVQGVTAGSRGSGVDLELPGFKSKPTRQTQNGEKSSSGAAGAQAEGGAPPELEKLAPQGTKLAIEKDDETGKMIVQIKDATTGDVIKQLPPEEVLRIAKSIEKYLGLLVDRRS